MEVNPIPPTTCILSTVVKENAVDISAKSRELHQLRQTVSDLTATVQALNLRFPLSSHINNRPHRSHDRQPNDPNHRLSNNGHCWYHVKFDAAARKCVEPCTFFASQKQCHTIDAATSSGASTQTRLFYITDQTTKRRFLIDAGAEVSVISPLPADRRQRQDYNFHVANSSKIATYGKRSITFNLTPLTPFSMDLHHC